MRTSARNQFRGRITQIYREAAHEEVELTLPGGERILALVSSHRSLVIGLKTGREAIALVDGHSVVLTTEVADAFMMSARNQLPGVIRRLQAGSLQTEVVVALTGGAPLVVDLSHESTRELELVAGKAVTAIFKASDVILGVVAQSAPPTAGEAPGQSLVPTGVGV